MGEREKNNITIKSRLDSYRLRDNEKKNSVII